jgi:hypothetical protein
MNAYRYILRRAWLSGDGRRACWIMLNPSTADEQKDDPTVRKCIGFSSRLGLSGLVVLNLYALRATNPCHLWATADPVGRLNDRVMWDALQTARARNWPVICAWGAHARPERLADVSKLLRSMIEQPHCLGVTVAGQPRHPLYVPYSAALRLWTPPEDDIASRPKG